MYPKAESTFLKDCIAGISDPTQIDNVIDVWHCGADSRSMEEMLGLTDEQFTLWYSDFPAFSRAIENFRRQSNKRPA